MIVLIETPYARHFLAHNFLKGFLLVKHFEPRKRNGLYSFLATFKSMKSIYWCEFPRECNWKKLAAMLGKREIVIYLTCSSREEYKTWKKKVHTYSKDIEVNAWPTLPFSEGYWFSGFTRKEMIDQLDQYRGLKIKIDIEPPKPKDEYSLTTSIRWLVFNFFRKAPNSKYLQNKIKALSKDTDIIVSTFPLPKFLLRQWGWVECSRLHYNYMHYSTFMPKEVRWLYNSYYKWFMKKNKGAYFAIGLVGTGIFRNEPIYKNIEEIKTDIEFLRKNGAQTLVFFRIESLIDKGQKWLEATFSAQDQ